jgi:hypothetical protein
MSTVAEDQKARLGDIDQIDRIELRIAERLFPRSPTTRRPPIVALCANSRHRVGLAVSGWLN